MPNVVSISNISVDEALRNIHGALRPTDRREIISTSAATGRVLAEDIDAQQDIPLFDNSAMDGYVLRKVDWMKGKRSYPVAFEIRPEDDKALEVPPGKCARIMTGAPIPPQGDLVIPVELSIERNHTAVFTGLPDRNPIRLKGEGYQAGKTILEKGSLIRPYEMGLMIESGNRDCTVFKPLRIAIQVTGSEVDEAMNTNGPVLGELLKSWPGVAVHMWPVLKDDPLEVRNRLVELKKRSDIIITTGGISAGRHDYLYAALEELGAQVLVRKINQKPGRPFTFSMWDGVPVCNLPGNPVSAVFCAEMYARRVAVAMLGIRVKDSVARAASPFNNPGSKTLFVPGLASVEQGQVVVRAEARMQSHLLQLYSGNNVYVRLQPGTEYAEGDEVTVIPFSQGSLPWL